MMKLQIAAARADFIDANEDLWSELTDWLLELSYEKCWYSDVIPYMSDCHVDHFRPKKIAKGLGNIIHHQNGYWWLAFDWTNYRVASTYCNCKRKEYGITYGKGEYFPLTPDSPICDIYGDHNIEKYYLLNPTIESDTRLLSFDEEGKVISLSAQDSWEHERVSKSVFFYHLDDHTLKKAQERYGPIVKSISTGLLILRDPEHPNDEVVKNALDDLMKILDPTKSLSSVAKACLLQSGYKWAEELVKDME